MIPDLQQDIIARLALECPALRQLGGAGDLEAAQTALKVRPAGFFLPFAERPSKPPFAAQFNQLVVTSFAIVLAVENRADATGAAALTDLVPVRRALRTALLGYKPADCVEPLAITGGRLVQLAGATLWWQDEFATAYMEQA